MTFLQSLPGFIKYHPTLFVISIFLILNLVSRLFIQTYIEPTPLDQKPIYRIYLSDLIQDTLHQQITNSKRGTGIFLSVLIVLFLYQKLSIRIIVF